MPDIYADIANRGYSAVAKEALGRKTDEIAKLRSLVQELTGALRHLMLNKAFLHPADWEIAGTALAHARAALGEKGAGDDVLPA